MSATVASRDLRNTTSAVLGRVAAGETLTITVSGRPVAELRPLRTGRPLSLPIDQYLRSIAELRADPDLRHDLAWISSDTTDDLGDL